MALGRPAEAEDAARHAIVDGLADERIRDALREAAAAARLARAQPSIAAAPAAERPEPRLLGETASIRLWHWPGEGPGTLVVFTPPGRKRSGPEEWWARGLSARLGWSTIVFAAHAPHWYPAADMGRLLPLALEVIPPGPRITYGVGIGGYGAFKEHGRALAADATLALSPAWSIDPADMPDDPRAERVFHAKRNAGMAVRPGDLALLPIIAFDPLLERDAAQARHLAAMPQVRAARRACPGERVVVDGAPRPSAGRGAGRGRARRGLDPSRSAPHLADPARERRQGARCARPRQLGRRVAPAPGCALRLRDGAAAGDPGARPACAAQA